MERRAIEVRGTVQGVGFRPFVHGLATRHGLSGSVRNAPGVVLIEVEGEAAELDRFLDAIRDEPPPLAKVDGVSWEGRPLRHEAGFRIEESQIGRDPEGGNGSGGPPILVAPDAATCPDCLAELFDPADRRAGYPFLNCTNCGPRLTIVTGAPYDRARTTMASFPMCPACRAEYEDPADRRFHAQPTACPECGPRLSLLDAVGGPITGDDPLGHFAAAILEGRIGALKGLGGYHLACDARNDAAVAELRRRKHRDEKPFAVMANDIEAAAELAEVSPAEEELLASPARPIVLLRRRQGGADTGAIAEAVAPGNPSLGVMLPYTPLHHLLMRAVGGIPLVMTSGNRSDEPIAYENDAPEQLRGIADLFLAHDRGIHVRCDDSVARVVDGAAVPLRRSRGYAPRPIVLPMDCPVPVLAVGGQLKATFALGRGNQAFLSHHLGDLDHFEAYKAFERDVLLYENLFEVTPECLVHDLHPDYATTRYAEDRARRAGIGRLAVQHHHAHMASAMAEHGLAGSVIGVTFDGTGYGTDGAVWGGEFLVGGYESFRRAAHLRYVPMPGADRAIREPWRMAASHLIDAGVGTGVLEARVPAASLRLVATMLGRRFQSPPTSSAGRLFDAVASSCGIRDVVTYEGQAAVELEWLASRADADGAYPFALDRPADSTGPLVADTRPLIRAVAEDVRRGVPPEKVSRRFHTAMVEMIADVCGRLRALHGPETVVLSGGVFLNALLASEAAATLRHRGFRVHAHRLVPPGDGGLSLGQLAVAAARLRAS
ncbi:Carbamoyltransferase HypF [Aquisphaera giovannonii]|uniref:Carbamoyltransferase n=1 Tax=Aquisphaera giovannonii TaxID=406548 RepID=A0A5B9W2K4_9BACT|nr:carbamoyltransferase HypF [Aquisphaera giovannonii]QEH34833.1 Carbamoyltransferase HypF [Aquisphaera giovannonii]